MIKKRNILFIHGYAATGASFNKLKNLDKSFNMITIDLPFTLIEGDLPSLDVYINYVNKFIKENNLKDFDVVGHSMGGAIALGIKDANKRILLAPWGPFVKAPVNWLMPQNLEDSKEAMENLFYDYKLHWNQNQLNKMASMHLHFYKTNAKKVDYLLKQQITNNKFAENVLYQMYLSKDFILINGTSDAYVPYEATQKTAKEFSKKLYKIEECGHSPVFEKPKETLELIEKILGD